MIKVYFLIFIISLNLYASSCLCTTEIDSIFSDIEEYIVDDYVDPTTDNIDEILIPQIDTNKESIDKQNDVLEKLLKAEKLRAHEAKKLVFLLEKLYNIEQLQ
ncbi:hypothetical protein [Halarcobacter sp.]|uniref:hypothetical protein n=1 Tax=Halarcobacter sp. TaxID=2321133 RepID=UPI003B007F24